MFHKVPTAPILMAVGLMVSILTVPGAFASPRAAETPPKVHAAERPPKVHASDGVVQSWSPYFDQLAASGVAVVFLGEQHDNEHHHRWQAEAVADLEKRFADRGGVAALVFEMIPEEKEAAANAARGWPQMASEQQSADVAAAVGWEASGWPAFALYAPILEAAPGAFVAGGGYPRSALMRSANAPDWLTKEPLAQRLGLNDPLPEGQRRSREAAQIAGHCNAIPASVAAMMVDAQRARDGRLARAVLRGREQAALHGRSGPVVVIAGSGHARRDYGAPALLARAAPELKVAALAFTEPGGLASEDLTLRFDAWAQTPPPLKPRGDLCAAFKKRKSAAEEKR